MNKLLFFFISFMMVSACGSADEFLEDLDEDIPVDTILVNPPSPTDSTSINPNDTITTKGDTIISPNDSTIISQDTTIIDDTLTTSRTFEIKYKWLFNLNSKSTKSCQGFAIYGNDLLNFHDTNNVIDIYSLKTYKQIASIELEPESAAHCNTVSFGTEFYSDEDKYPLLYAQQNGLLNKINVYRIIYKDSIYSAQKIQTISLTPCYHSLTAIDRVNKQLYVIYANNGKRYISQIAIPNYSNSLTSVDLRKAQKTHAISIPKVVQDTAFDNGKLYFICGKSKEGELWIIDMHTKIANIIDLTKYKMYDEPEGLEVYKGNVLISFLNKSIYQITIK